MAVWRRPADPRDAPADFDPALHGAGEGAIRQWGREAVAWLNANPGRCVSWGDGDGDTLTVLRRQVRLLELEWFGPRHAAQKEAERALPYHGDER